MFHPWRALRALRHVVVVWARPHPAIPAATDGTRTIWLDPRLLQVERRCALTHELVHIERGHAGCQPRAVEHAVRAEAARRLITHQDLLRAMPWALSLEELADDLWVTPMVLTDRLAGLTRVERDDITARLPDHPA